jgi:MFS family permease
LTNLDAHRAGTNHPDRWAVLGVCCVGLFLLVSSLSSLNVALPDMQRDLGASAGQLQWIVDAYAVVFGGLLLTGGAIGDRIGRRRSLAVGFAILLAAGCVGGVATSVAVVMGARVLSGLGAALMMPATLSTLTEVFEPAGQRQAIAIWSGVAGGGGAFGPLVGGWLTTIWSWSAVFWLASLVAACGLLGVVRYVPNLRPAARAPLDWLGAVLSTATIGLILYAIIAAPDGWTHPATVGSAIAGVAALVGFIWWERHTPDPMLPLQIFAHRRVRAGVLTLLLAAIGFAGVLFVAALWLQLGWRETALVTGALLVPIGVVELGVSTQSPRLCARFGTGATVAFGLCCMAVGYLGMAATPTGLRAGIVAAGLVAGAGNGLVIPPSVDRIVHGVEPELAGVTAGVNETSIELGASLGVALLGVLQRLVFDWQRPAGSTAAPEADLMDLTGPAADPAVVAAFQSGSRAALVAAALAALIALPVAALRSEQD